MAQCAKPGGERSNDQISVLFKRQSFAGKVQLNSGGVGRTLELPETIERYSADREREKNSLLRLCCDSRHTVDCVRQRVNDAE
jgi:hypothetical protein